MLSGWVPNRHPPARYTPTWLREMIPADQLQRAQLAAHLGVGRLPQQPGLWLRTTGNGNQRLYRVSHHNGQLYATVGRLLPVAVPTTALPGYWHPVR